MANAPPRVDQAAVLPLQRQRLVDRVAENLREAIFSGKIPAGTKLIQEDLCEQLGISRTPLRQAFRILERDGLVEPSSKSNTVVVVEFTDRDIRELYQIREIVDGLAARLTAARNLRASELAHIARNITQMSKAIDPRDTPRYMQAHVAFHVGLLSASGNTRLLQYEAIVRISSEMLYLRLSANPKHPEVLTRERQVIEHQLILDAVLAGQQDLAENHARQHVCLALAAWGDYGQNMDDLAAH